jgi:hypothetical protein
MDLRDSIRHGFLGMGSRNLAQTLQPSQLVCPYLTPADPSSIVT